MHYRICWRRLQKIEFRLRLYRKGARHTVRENMSGMEFADSAFTLPNQSSRKLLQEPRWRARPLVLHYRSIQAMGNLQHLGLWYQTFYFFEKKITWNYHICGIGKKNMLFLKFINLLEILKLSIRLEKMSYVLQALLCLVRAWSNSDLNHAF